MLVKKAPYKAQKNPQKINLSRNFTAEAKAKWYCWLIIIQIIKDKSKKMEMTYDFTFSHLISFVIAT